MSAWVWRDERGRGNDAIYYNSRRILITIFKYCIIANKDHFIHPFCYKKCEAIRSILTKVKVYNEQGQTWYVWVSVKLHWHFHWNKTEGFRRELTDKDLAGGSIIRALKFSFNVWTSRMSWELSHKKALPPSAEESTLTDLRSHLKHCSSSVNFGTSPRMGKIQCIKHKLFV